MIRQLQFGDKPDPGELRTATSAFTATSITVKADVGFSITNNLAAMLGLEMSTKAHFVEDVALKRL